MSDTTPL